MVSRRNFISHSASAIVAGLVMPSILNESSMFARSVGANDKINVGLIGCKGMGWSDLSDFLLYPEVDWWHYVTSTNCVLNMLIWGASQPESSRPLFVTM